MFKNLQKLEIKNNQTNSNPGENIIFPWFVDDLVLFFAYWGIIEYWLGNDFYSSNFIIIIQFLCIPLLILSYSLFKKFLLKMKFFINKVTLSYFFSGLLSLTLMILIIKVLTSTCNP